MLKTLRRDIRDQQISSLKHDQQICKFPDGLDVLDKHLANVREVVLGRHPKERRKHCEFWKLVPCWESARQSTGQFVEPMLREGSTHPGV